MKAVSDLFNIEYGDKLDMNKMTKSTASFGIAFVGRKGGLEGHSGVSGYVAPVAGFTPHPPGSLTVALGGSRLLSTYVQQRPFYTAQNVAVLTPKDPDMSLNDRLYYAMCIRHNAFRYTAFGREANRTLGAITLPETVPDWAATSQVPSTSGLSRAAGTEQPLSDVSEWEDFRLGDLFTLRKGRRVTKSARLPGQTRFVGASEKINGVTDRCNLPAIFRAGSLTVAYNGNSVGFSFYQEVDFFACDDVNVLEPKSPVSMWALLFVATLIKHNRSRFTYGYKWTLARMTETNIKLPSANGKPDWAQMEEFMKGLPFSRLLSDRIANQPDVGSHP